MNANKFRQELMKIMPGYQWTVHRGRPHCLSATGTQTSGFNRLSTLMVTRHEKEGDVRYVAKSAGHGLKARWLHTAIDSTLARALRGLQNHYEAEANTYRSHAAALERGRSEASNQLGGARQNKVVAENE